MNTGEKNIAIITLSAVGVAILLAVVLFFIGRRRGKQLESSGNKGLMPSQTDYGASLDETESQLIQRHALALYNDMKGLNFLRRDAKIYTEYLASSDRVFVGTANYFYDNYGNGENLAKWLKGESFVWTNMNELTATVESILKRLAQYGINP